jgi:hypothetical protein
VHRAYVREGAGHALIGAREWIPAATSMTRSSLGSWPADGLALRSKGQLAIGIFAGAFADGDAAELRRRRRGLRLVH